MVANVDSAGARRFELVKKLIEPLTEAATALYENQEPPDEPSLIVFFDFYHTCQIGTQGMSGVFNWPCDWFDLPNKLVEATHLIDNVRTQVQADKQARETAHQKSKAALSGKSRTYVNT